MKCGGVFERHLNVARDMVEGQKVTGEFAGVRTKAAQNTGKEYSYVVFVSTIDGVTAEWLIFPRNLVCREVFDPEKENRTCDLTKRGSNLVVEF